MIEGAVLPAQPTIADLKKWLKTRHGMWDIGLSSATRAELLDVVKKQQEKETELEERGEDIHLRDPSGRSLEQIVLGMHPTEGWHFPSVTEEIQLPTAGWITEPDVIKRDAPAVSDLVWLQHWQHVVTTGRNSSRGLLEDASSRCKEMTRLLEFAYHPNPELPQIHGSGQETVLFRLFIPASLNSRNHLAWVEVSVCRIPGLPAASQTVVRGRCSCAIGSTSRCVHIAILLMVVHNLPREGEMAEVEPVTSRLCRWNHPGEGPMYDVTKPLSMLPFLKESKESRARASRGEPAQKRVAQCSSDNSHRSRYIPLAMKDVEKLKDGMNPMRCRKRMRFLGVVKLNLGEDCGAGAVWGDLPDE